MTRAGYSVSLLMVQLLDDGDLSPGFSTSYQICYAASTVCMHNSIDSYLVAVIVHEEMT